jgi:hypothetical protein
LFSTAPHHASDDSVSESQVLINALIGNGPSTTHPAPARQEKYKNLSISPPLMRRMSEAKQQAPQEPDMTKHPRIAQSPKTLTAAVVGFGLLVLAGNLTTFATHLFSPFGAAANEAPAVLRSIVSVAIVQALQDCALDPQRLERGFLQTVVSFWLLLVMIAGAVLLSKVFASKLEA